MTQISYQPAFDAYNAAFRMMRLRESCWTKSAISFEALRIADFYVLFPFLISDVKVRREHMSWKKIAGKYVFKKPYARLPNSQVLFKRMLPFQLAAFERIVDSDFALLENWSHGQALASRKDFPSEIDQKITTLNSEQSDLIEAIATMVDGYPLLGPDGLKARTQLQEYRYDAV
jgi:hypothetical protein